MRPLSSPASPGPLTQQFVSSNARLSDLVIRPFREPGEYEACTRFQEEIWGQGFNERVSSAILMVANRIGGLSAGAFDAHGVLQGFVFGLTGIEGGELVHWSDMLAVREGYRDQGLGTRLKHYQREILLSRGVRLMRWTFDPLQSRNAYVNLEKLGIVTSEYVRDMYGDTGSPLHRGVGTDRLVAFWEMDSPRVSGRIEGKSPRSEWGLVQGAPQIVSFRKVGPFPEPEGPFLDLAGPNLLLSIPADIDEMVELDPGLALEWREATREGFLHYFQRGYQVTGMVPREDVSFYLLSR